MAQGIGLDDCKVLMDQADRMKASRDAQHPSTYNKPKGKRTYGNNYTKEEVNRIVNLATKKASGQGKGQQASPVSQTMTLRMRSISSHRSTSARSTAMKTTRSSEELDSTVNAVRVLYVLKSVTL